MLNAQPCLNGKGARGTKFLVLATFHDVNPMPTYSRDFPERGVTNFSQWEPVPLYHTFKLGVGRWVLFLALLPTPAPHPPLHDPG